MQVHVLASGSRGNAIFLRLGNTNILIDAGISTRRIKNALSEVGMNIQDLQGILITHEHRDHIAGLPTLMKKYGIPVYARPAAWQAMYCRHLLPDECCCTLTDELTINDVTVRPFSTSHDAADPVGFNLFYEDIKLSVATDLGFVTDTVKEALALADVMILEANHDLDMLRKGSYPWPLKRRIMSNKGHLSNTDAGWTLARLPHKQRIQVFLAHLSQENNTPSLAKQTVMDILQGEGFDSAQFKLHLTYPDRITSM